MPHAQKACQKKSANEREKIHTQRKYATCPQDMLKEKKEENNIYSVQISRRSARESNSQHQGLNTKDETDQAYHKHFT
jgi:hypothetical protein